ncbi:MAG: flagellar export chaperone FlgN [Treponemataceae bacterium]
MEKYGNLVARCADVLRQETALLERLAAAQEVVRNAAFARDWSNMESLLTRLKEYGSEFELLEAERDRVFAEFGESSGGSVGFYSVASRLDPTSRKELTELYRRLKMDTLKVRLANDALSTYLSAARSTLTDFLDAAFPDRRGKLYSRRGSAVHPEMRSIVLDRSF